jgi:hypothetical protein
LSLWLRHVLDAELESRHVKRVFVSYSDFLADWMKIIEQIEDRLDIKLSALTPDVQAAVESFIDREMRHHTIDNKALALECSGHPFIAETYGALERLMKRSDDSMATSALDNVRGSFDGAMRTFGDGLCGDLFSVQTKLYSATNRIAELETQVSELNYRLSALQERSDKVSRELAIMHDMHRIEQDRISRLGSLLEEAWTRELRQKDELRQPSRELSA